MKTRYYIIDNNKLTLTDICKGYSINKNTVRSRMHNYKISPIEAILNYNRYCQHSNIKLGDRYGHLVVISKIKDNFKKNSLYKCKCDCGSYVNKLGLVLKKSKNPSCNFPYCKYSNIKKHNLSKLSEYKIWSGIKQRCLNKKNPSYPYYGGIGINIDKLYINNFQLFYDDIGPRPSKIYSVDRIDVTKGYIKGNIKWATKEEQMNNTRKVNNLTMEIKKLKNILHKNKIEY